MIKLTIPRVTPSNNQLIRKHWSFRYEQGKTWQMEIRMHVYDFDRRNPGYFVKYKVGDKKKVKIISYRKRKIDPENCTGGFKPLLDALVYNGLILDDSPKYIELETEQKTDTKNPRTEIFISDLT